MSFKVKELCLLNRVNATSPIMQMQNLNQLLKVITYPFFLTQDFVLLNKTMGIWSVNRHLVLRVLLTIWFHICLFHSFFLFAQILNHSSIATFLIDCYWLCLILCCCFLLFTVVVSCCFSCCFLLFSYCFLLFYMLFSTVSAYRCCFIYCLFMGTNLLGIRLMAL